MSGWNEENFLEQMAPLLKHESRPGLCPDVETLGAVIDGSAAPGVREAVAAHRAGCPVCAELEVRLRLFGAASRPETEEEWRQTEKRLDNRMQAFLGARAEEVRRAAWWDVRSWNVMWLLAPAAALGIATLLVWVRPVSRPALVETAGVRATAPPAVEIDKPAPGITTLSGTKTPDPVVTQPPAAAPVTAPQAEDNPISPIQAETPAPLEPQSAPAAADRVVSAETPSTHASMRSAAGLVPTGGQEAARQAPSPAVPPAAVRINAGTRVWILLKSTSPQANGDFKFRGIVLLPVTQAGAVLLDRETEVIGIGKVNQGRTTIRIVEFVWQGARYRLRGAPEAMNSPGPGAGPAVEFNAGQVLETWLAAVSTYERIPREGSPTQE